MKAILCNKKIWLAIAFLAAGGAIAGWKHKEIRAWYYVRHLAGAYPDQRDGWARKAAALGESAKPRLLAGLGDPDALVCANMQCALYLMGKAWGLDDPRLLEMIEEIQARFHDFSPPGREKALLLLASLMHAAPAGEGGGEMQEMPHSAPPRVVELVGAIMADAERQDELRGIALLLAAELIDAMPPGQGVDQIRPMAERGLAHAAPGARVAALQLLARAPMRGCKDLLQKALPLLHDPEPVVRKAALVTFAAETDLARDEIFLPLLHDEEGEVRTWCELVLRKRGRSDEDIEIARLISAKNAAQRLRVPNLLMHMPDLNLAAWVRQLSVDESPAVRAAAVRAVFDHPQVELDERLREMAQRDPSAAVRQNARVCIEHLSRLRDSSSGRRGD